MKIFSKSQIATLEKDTMKANGLNYIALINAAADAFVNYFVDTEISINSSILIYCGNGHNGSDGIQIGNRLVTKGYKVKLVVINVSKNKNSDFNTCYKELYSSIPSFNLDLQDLPAHIIPFHDVLIDGILGTGINKDLSPILIDFIDRINLFKSYKIAIDIPTGIWTDEGPKGPAVKCDKTIGISTAKMGYFLDENIDHIGKLIIVNVPVLDQFHETIFSDIKYITIHMIRSMLKPAGRLDHKYTRGHALLVGGSHGMAGCMKLSGEAALRAGCGIVSLHVSYSAVSFLQASFPEAIIDIDDNKYHVGAFELTKKYNSIGIGPGMGFKTKQIELITKLLEQAKDIPMLFDADALTVLAGIAGWQELVPKGSIITPHKGEFERLFGKFNNQKERIEFMRSFSQRYGIVILLKGADTFITSPNGELYINNNGNSGMATAGSGDVLTGIITGLMAQGYNTTEAAMIGSYLHGSAANFAIRDSDPLSLIASDIVNNLGVAYSYINQHGIKSQ